MTAPALLGWVLLAAPAEPPLQLGREQAAELARAELADPAYHDADGSLLLRALRWLADRLDGLLDRVAAATPGGWIGLLGLAVALVAVIAVVRWRIGPIRRRAAVDPLFDAGAAPETAADHRRRAVAATRRGAYDDAVREWLRAVVRELEERGLLEPRPGRTATEAAAAAGGVLPGQAEDLATAAARFGEIWYGGRAATSADAAALAALDEAVRAARPSGPPPAPPALAAPR